MATDMKAISEITRGMEVELNFMLTVLNTKDNLQKTKEMERVN